MTLLRVSGLVKNGIDRLVVNNISFTQRKGQKIAIAGETGSGKSTLVKMIAGLSELDGGEVIFDGKTVKGPDERLVPGQPGVAYLSQDYELPRFLRVEQVLEYAGNQSLKKSGRLFEVCRIDHLLGRKTDELSGGERQRIALARLLLTTPKLLLLDEPFSNLDRTHKLILKAVIEEASQKLSLSCILISHEPDDLLGWADTILILRKGRVVQRGTPQKIYREPKNPYIAGLLGAFTILDEGNPFTPNQSGRRIVRPEQFKLSSEGGGHPARIVRTSFLGAHYELILQLGSFTITALTGDHHYQVGDIAHIDLRA